MRIRSLDSLRFLAAACVALYHFDIDLRLHIESLTGSIERFGIFVDFFFILSGFVIAINYADKIDSWKAYGLFIQKRLARVYPLHFVVLLVFLSAGLLANRLGIPMNYPDFFRLDALPANLLLVQAWGVVNHPSFNAASWSISAELFVYILFPLLAFLAANLRPMISLLLIVLFVAIMVVIRRAVGLSPWAGATFDFGMLRAVPTFFLGVLLARNLAFVADLFRARWAYVYALLLAALAAMHYGVPDDLIIAIFASIVMTAACAELQNKSGLLVSPVLVTLGDASYAIYMTHGIVLMPTVFFVKHTFGLGTAAAAGVGGLALIATFGLSVQIHKWFEDPMRRYFSRTDFWQKRPAQTAQGTLPTFGGRS